MQAEHSIRSCIACNKPVSGRSDKKFCNDYCRNDFNNARKADNPAIIKNINRVLARNREIMHSFFRGNETRRKIDRDKLIAEGFRFKYHTHKMINKKGIAYYFCYDTGYVSVDDDHVLVIRKKNKCE